LALFLDLSLVVLTRIGLSYLTSELCGGIMAQATVGSECEFQQRAVRVSFRRATNTGPAFIHGLDKVQKAGVGLLGVVREAGEHNANTHTAALVL
jgi:hypothetical protein